MNLTCYFNFSSVCICVQVVLSLSVLTFAVCCFLLVFFFFCLSFSLYFFLPLMFLSSLSSKGIKKEHTHTHYMGHMGHIWALYELLFGYTSIVAVLLHKHIASVWCLFFNDISLAHSCRYHHLYWLLRKQWSHGYWWRTKRTDWIRHSVQPKWPGISSDQTDLLQLHSSSSL